MNFKLAGPITTPSPVELAGQRQHNERWTMHRDSARNWRRAAGVMAGLLAASGWWNYHQASAVRIVPYIVEVDHYGKTRAVERLEQVAPLDPRLVKAAIRNWIHLVRTVVSDPVAERQMLTDAYGMLDGGGAAMRVFSVYVAEHSPIDRAQKGSVMVDVSPPTPTSPDSWRVEWSEQKYNKDGTKDGPPEFWTAFLDIALVPPSAEDAAFLANPIGLYIRTINWSRARS